MECRLSPTTTLVVTFNKNIESGQATIGSGSATIDGSPSFEGSQMTINLTGVGDAKTLRINLEDIQAADGGRLDDGVIALRLLLGDVNGDGTVSTSDVNLTRAATGTALTTQNFRRDVKPDGVVSTSDVNTVRIAEITEPVSTGTWLVAHYTFSVDLLASPGTYTLSTFSDPGTGWVGPDPFDNFEFDSRASLSIQIIPEPQVPLLLLGGLLFLTASGARRRARCPQGTPCLAAV